MWSNQFDICGMWPDKVEEPTLKIKKQKFIHLFGDPGVWIKTPLGFIIVMYEQLSISHNK